MGNENVKQRPVSIGLSYPLLDTSPGATSDNGGEARQLEQGLADLCHTAVPLARLTRKSAVYWLSQEIEHLQKACY